MQRSASKKSLSVTLSTIGKIFASKSLHILNIIYPPLCIMCQETVCDAAGLCASCWQKIDFISAPLCNICGKPFEFSAANTNICGQCMQNKPRYTKARSVFVYNKASHSLVTSYKYQDKTQNTKLYAKWMVQKANIFLNEVDYIIPVPIHFLKLLTRKYNQAALLAKAIANQIDKPALLNAINRYKYTKKQAGLLKNKRIANVAGAFRIRPKYQELLKNKNILLIDDVITTGATINECCKILLKCQVKNIYVLSLAKTLR